MKDRYEAIGLARNPFAAPSGDDENEHEEVEQDEVEHEEEPFRGAGRASSDREPFISRGLDPPPPPGSLTVVQVIGESGAGKTTHVRRWQRAQPGPYHYIVRRPYRHRWATPPLGPLVYGDEIDRMPRPLRRRWFHRLARIEATVVIGTHVDLETLARRAGFDVTTHHLGAIDKATLSAIMEARLAAVAIESTTPEGRGDHSVPGDAQGASQPVNRFGFSDDDINTIFRQSEGSIRKAEVVAHRLLAEYVL